MLRAVLILHKLTAPRTPRHLASPEPRHTILSMAVSGLHRPPYFLAVITPILPSLQRSTVASPEALAALKADRLQAMPDLQWDTEGRQVPADLAVTSKLPAASGISLGPARASTTDMVLINLDQR